MNCPRCGSRKSGEFATYGAEHPGWRAFCCIDCADNGYRVEWRIYEEESPPTAEENSIKGGM